MSVLSKPFRGMPKLRLGLLLVLFLAIEGALSYALKQNNQQATAASAPPTPVVSTVPAVLEGLPAVAPVGSAQQFSVKIPDLAGKAVTYTVHYLDGSVDTATVHADGTGFTKRSFVLRYNPAGRHQSIGVDVSVAGVTRASGRFPVLLTPRRQRP